MKQKNMIKENRNRNCKFLKKKHITIDHRWRRLINLKIKYH